MTFDFSTPKGAHLSACQRYRYLLWRCWAGLATETTALKMLLWIMLNPSTADADQDDATIRVCCGRARHLGFGGIIVVNLFALRATHPRELYSHPYPISEPRDWEANDRYVHVALDLAPTHVICAWGKHGSLRERGVQMLKWLRPLQSLWALRINKDGSPAHPLRIPYDQPLVRL